MVSFIRSSADGPVALSRPSWAGQRAADGLGRQADLRPANVDVCRRLDRVCQDTQLGVGQDPWTKHQLTQSLGIRQSLPELFYNAQFTKVPAAQELATLGASSVAGQAAVDALPGLADPKIAST